MIANVISAGLDLRTLGIAPELGLIVRDEVSTSRLPQYTLDLHANKDSRKYHLHVYSTPVFGREYLHLPNQKSWSYGWQITTTGKYSSKKLLRTMDGFILEFHGGDSYPAMDYLTENYYCFLADVIRDHYFDLITIFFTDSKSGIKIQLPSRVMVLEQSVAYPTDKPLPFPIKGELVLDLDKNKSGHKAAARFLIDLELENADKQTAVAEFGFSHPKIDKVGRDHFSTVKF